MNLALLSLHGESLEFFSCINPNFRSCSQTGGGRGDICPPELDPDESSDIDPALEPNHGFLDLGVCIFNNIFYLKGHILILI